jgi:hypothetical protein
MDWTSFLRSILEFTQVFKRASAPNRLEGEKSIGKVLKITKK